jgi:hypothetical protein
MQISRENGKSKCLLYIYKKKNMKEKNKKYKRKNKK